MNRTHLWLILVAAALALALRWPGLDRRPMHNDEAVNAIKFGALWERGTYKYDPNEHHGPTLYYATAAVGRLTGAPGINDYTDARLRWVTVLFGLGLVLLLPLLADGLGRKGTAWAALFTAVSPALVFYSRYYIHEMLLVFFALLALVAGWRYWRSRSLAWALVAGAALGLMDATKETFVISLAAAAVALALNLVWKKFLDASASPAKVHSLNWGHVAAILGAWAVVAVVFFTSFFTNASGPLDSIRSYVPWLNRAGGESPHIHPWYFYWQRLLWFHPAKGPVWTELFLLGLAVVGGVAGFRRKALADASATLVRFLAMYAVVLGAAYSVIGYKTPWCLLNFWHPVVLLGGVGAAVLIEFCRSRRWKFVVGFFLLIGAGHLGWEAWQLALPYSADRRNPYAYSQTSPDLLNLVRRVETIAAADPRGTNLVIKVMSPEDDYWPLPWYLRRFPHVGWWSQLPAEPYAPMMIVSPKLHAELDEKKTHLMTGYSQLRPQVFLELYVELELWKEYLAKNPPPKED